MDPLVNNSSSSLSQYAPSSFPVERLTESILALSDAAVIITNGPAIDYCTNSIVSVLGVTRETIMQGGWNALKDLMHPIDLRMLRKKILPEIRKHFKGLTDKERVARTFSYTVRMRTDLDQYIILAIENRPLQWKRKDWPSVYLTILRDITPFGDNAEMLVNVYEQIENKSYNKVLQRNYIFCSEKFSARETEIIRYITQGYTSKRIAAALFISPETVRNHRRNIMQKAGCSTSSALTNLALQEGII